MEFFKSGDPKKRAKAIVEAVKNYDNPEIIARVSEDLGEAMVGINENEIKNWKAFNSLYFSFNGV